MTGIPSPAAAGGGVAQPSAEREVTALYEAHALSLIRLAFVTLGDRAAAEDVVHDAFLGLYRRWDHLRDTGSAPGYLRSSVLNGCRTALRNRARRRELVSGSQAWESAEAIALLGEEHRQLLFAITKLPARQREALVHRYYLGLSEAETAQSMGITRGTVKSATSRALATLGRRMREQS